MASAAPVPDTQPAPLPPPPAADGMPVMLLSLLLPLLLAIYFLFGRRAGGGRGRSLLLFGPVGGGKSALYQRMKRGYMVPTVSSMEPAAASFALKTGEGATGADAPVHVCDMPGTGRLRATEIGGKGFLT